MMAYYDALITEWASHTGATQKKLDEVNAKKVAGSAVQMLVPGWVIYNSLAPNEFQALTAPQQQFVRDIFIQSVVDLSAGKPARQVLQQLFGAGTTTRANVIAAVASYDAPQVSWLAANGYPNQINDNDLRAAGLS